MSDCALHDVLHRTGSLQVLRVCPDAADIQDRIAQAAAGRKWRPNRGVGHRCGRCAPSSRDRQGDPSGAPEEPGSATALAGGIPRSQGLSLLPDRR